MYGGQGEDSIEGGAGLDAAYASDQDDEVRGGPGRDRIYGGFGNDRVFGDAGPDIVDGSQGIDELEGGSEVDICLNGELVLGCEHRTARQSSERNGRAEAIAGPPRIDVAPTRDSATGALSADLRKPDFRVPGLGSGAFRHSAHVGVPDAEHSALGLLRW